MRKTRRGHRRFLPYTIVEGDLRLLRQRWTHPDLGVIQVHTAPTVTSGTQWDGVYADATRSVSTNAPIYHFLDARRTSGVRGWFVRGVNAVLAHAGWYVEGLVLGASPAVRLCHVQTRSSLRAFGSELGFLIRLWSHWRPAVNRFDYRWVSRRAFPARSARLADDRDLVALLDGINRHASEVAVVVTAGLVVPLVRELRRRSFVPDAPRAATFRSGPDA